MSETDGLLPAEDHFSSRSQMIKTITPGYWILAKQFANVVSCRVGFSGDRRMNKYGAAYGLKAAGFAACVVLLAGALTRLDAFSDAKAADDGYELKTIVPQWNDKGELLLPKDFREWVFIGSPLTPNGLNDGKANFPEYHNVYVQPEAFKAYRKTGKWPTGTMMLKELQLVDDPKGEFPDGSRFEPSGRGYFPGPVNGVDVSVKDPKRFPDSKGWGYFNFNHKAPPYLKSTAAKPVEECASCHIANADEDMVYMKLYRPIVTPLPE